MYEIRQVINKLFKWAVYDTRFNEPIKYFCNYSNACIYLNTLNKLQRLKI